MKEIEIIDPSDKDALEFAMKQFRLPNEAFVYIGSELKSAEEGAPSETHYRFQVNMDYFNNLVLDKVKRLLDFMGIQADVRVRSEKEFLMVDVFSESGSILIGKKGETLEAIQHLINRMISRSEREMPLILVDVENYRERVNRRLKKIALSAADKVQKSGQPVELEPMAAGERKFIHKLLSEIEGITTYSLGREGQRCVIVAPENAPRTTYVGDEEILPEFLNDISSTPAKRRRPLHESASSSNGSGKSSEFMDELIEPETE
mgnify:CR=1 FL=1